MTTVCAILKEDLLLRAIFNTFLAQEASQIYALLSSIELLILFSVNGLMCIICDDVNFATYDLFQ